MRGDKPMKHEGFTPGPPCTRCGLPNLPEESGTCAACIDLEEADCIAEDDGRPPEGGTVGAELLVALRRSGRENASLLAENERLREALSDLIVELKRTDYFSGTTAEQNAEAALAREGEK
jgi:hypothetical protein